MLVARGLSSGGCGLMAPKDPLSLPLSDAARLGGLATSNSQGPSIRGPPAWAPCSCGPRACDDPGRRRWSMWPPGTPSLGRRKRFPCGWVPGRLPVGVSTVVPTRTVLVLCCPFSSSVSVDAQCGPFCHPVLVRAPCGVWRRPARGHVASAVLALVARCPW